MTKKRLRFCQFGAGRIGLIHAGNIAAHADAELACIVDPHAEAASELAARHGAEVTTAEAALADGAIDAVVIASSTDTHADLIEAAARAGKAIFCEKPVDLDSRRVDQCLNVVRETGASLFVGFNRRFDPSFAALKKRIDAGHIGKVEMIVITSRDPGLPSMDYLKGSGGMFRDMMIHDLDITRWILGEDPVQIFAAASCLVDPAVGEVNDVDSAVVTLKFASGRLVQISNSRRAAYGYDQRIEVHGRLGMIQVENQRPTSLEVATAENTSRDNPLHFFLERYAQSYRLELDAFISAVLSGGALSPGGEDGRIALRLADAALDSHLSGAAVTL
jgi:myo-inositol 2-dehydrogenase/D-chiro-inositol 1-dehydrogenase